MANPFSDELSAIKVTLEGTKKIGKELCHVIDVVYAQESAHAIWYISTSDFLPRRVDRVFDHPKYGRATVETILKDLAVGTELLPEELLPTVPAKFEKLKCFAPDVRRMVS